MRKTPAIVWLAVLAWSGSASADLLYFVGGGQVQLPAKLEGNEVHLTTPDGPLTFLRGDFLAIVPEQGPEQEWPARRDASTSGGDAAAKFAAAWWALENGLTAEGLALLVDAREGAAGHEPTRRALAMIDALAPPFPDPDLGPLHSRLRPSRFKEIRSDHVVLLHQVGDAEARERLDLLERVVATFYVTLAAQGIELTIPRHRLISVWFAEKRDYASFLHRAEADEFAETQGYYHPTLKAVFAFDARSTETHRATRRAIANRKKAGESATDFTRQTLLLDLEWRTIDLGIAAHETIHQLTAASGLAPHLDDFPLWLHEGLAAQFEVVRGGRWAGVGRTNDLRLPDWRAVRPRPRLILLLRDTGLGQGYRRDVYAGSWALVYFLRKTHPGEFRTFLDLIRVPHPDPASSSDRSLTAFRAAFGEDLAGLESAWHRYIGDLRTPLEAGRPSAGVEAAR